MCTNEKMTGMANLIIELVCAWLHLTGYLTVVKVESQRLTFKNKLVLGLNIGLNSLLCRSWLEYSTPPNTGLSGIRMVIFRTLFCPVFGLLA
jgi:hypothetical protein